VVGLNSGSGGSASTAPGTTEVTGENKVERYKRIHSQSAMGSKDRGGGLFLFEFGIPLDLASKEGTSGFHFKTVASKRMYCKNVKWSDEMATTAFTYEEIKKKVSV
jgi:hypothetical protein